MANISGGGIAERSRRLRQQRQELAKTAEIGRIESSSTVQSDEQSGSATQSIVGAVPIAASMQTARQGDDRLPAQSLDDRKATTRTQSSLPSGARRVPQHEETSNVRTSQVSTLSSVSSFNAIGGSRTSVSTGGSISKPRSELASSRLFSARRMSGATDAAGTTALSTGDKSSRDSRRANESVSGDRALHVKTQEMADGANREAPWSTRSVRKTKSFQRERNSVRVPTISANTANRASFLDSEARGGRDDAPPWLINPPRTPRSANLASTRKTNDALSTPNDVPPWKVR